MAGAQLVQNASSRFDGLTLEKALSEGRFEQEAAPLIGMVKASENKGHISFTPAGCDSWVDIPSSMIERAQFIGNQRCKDHSHAMFQLMLKKPKDSEAKALVELLTAYASGNGYGGESYPDYSQGQLSAMMADDIGSGQGFTWPVHPNCVWVPIRVCSLWYSYPHFSPCLAWHTELRKVCFPHPV